MRSDSMTVARMDPSLDQLIRDVPAHAAAPRPDVLLGDPPPAAPRSGPRRTRSTATCAPRTRSSTARAGPPAPRRAARRWTPGSASSSAACAAGRSTHPIVGALVDAGPAPPAAARRAAHLHALDADRLRAGADRDLAGAGGLHGRLGRLGRADHGAAARRAGAPPRRLRAARPGVPARRTSSATCARTRALDRVYLPAEDRARFGVGEARPARAPRVAGAARAAGARGPPRARRCSPRPSRRWRAAPGSVRTGIRFAVGVYQRVLDRVERIEFDVLGRRTGVRAGSCRARRWERCAGDAPGDAARRRARRRSRATTPAPTC